MFIMDHCLRCFFAYFLLVALSIPILFKTRCFWCRVVATAVLFGCYAAQTIRTALFASGGEGWFGKQRLRATQYYMMQHNGVE